MTSTFFVFAAYHRTGTRSTLVQVDFILWRCHVALLVQIVLDCVATLGTTLQGWRAALLPALRPLRGHAAARLCAELHLEGRRLGIFPLPRLQLIIYLVCSNLMSTIHGAMMPATRVIPTC
jgi:hypothetical protein